MTVSYGGMRNISNTADNDPANRQLPLFRKPIIVIEGFDSWKFEGEEGVNYSFTTFLNEDVRGISRVVFDENTVPVTSFSTQLADDGQYDIVFVDFEHGSGDIRRNAMIVANVIEWVTAHYAADGSVPTVGGIPIQNGGIPTDPYKIVVMGQSMGGLIGRFALGYLDQGPTVLQGQGGPAVTVHPDGAKFVRHLITRDSPHRGAITPMALQVVTRRMANLNMWWPAIATVPHPLYTLPAAFMDLQDIVPLLHDSYALLHEPASLQLNLEQEIYMPHLVPTPQVTGNYYPNSGNAFRDTQYRQMITYTGPVVRPYELTMLSNGSECGTPQPLAPYDELVRVEAHYRNSALMVLPGVGTVVTGVGLLSGALSLRTEGDRGWLTQSLIAGVLSGYSIFTGRNFDSRVILNSNPAGGPAQIVNARARYRIRIYRWGPLSLLPLYIPLRLFNIEYDSRSNAPTYERAPGGYYLNDLSFKLPHVLNWQAGPFIDNETTIYIRDKFAFVPTASAIDSPEDMGAPLTQAQLFRGYTDDGPQYSKSTAERFVT